MRRFVALLEQEEIHAFRSTMAFLEGRLEEAATVDWALHLGRRDEAQKTAVSTLLRSNAGGKLSELWNEAWRLIEESWSNQRDIDEDFSEYELRSRIRAGERSSALIADIVQRVSAYVDVKPFSRLEEHFRKTPKEPRQVSDLFSVSMKSAKSIDPTELGIYTIDAEHFILELATALDLAVLTAIAHASRMGWDQQASLWRLGGLNRVFFVAAAERPDTQHEPDEFHEGIAPSVKLLHATVRKLGQMNRGAASAFLQRWRQFDSAVHDRLWASLAQSLATDDQIFEFLSSLNQRRFWDVSQHPEIALLRAQKYEQLSREQQAHLAARLRKGPPQYLWRRDVEPEVRRHYQRYIILREMRRIELGGGTLPETLRHWFEAQLPEFPDIGEMSRIDEGFPGLPRAHAVPPNPDDRYDNISGVERLRVLDRALRSARKSWDNDPAQRASDWITTDDNALSILRDLGEAANPNEFSHVLNRLGWAHNLSKAQQSKAVKKEAASFAKVLLRLDQDTISDAIEGITWWLSTWARYLKRPEVFALWHKIWPVAVRATNKLGDAADEDVEFAFETPTKSAEARELDTLNNPTGRLVALFLAICPGLDREPKPFRRGTALRRIRNEIASVTGRSHLIATHRLLEALHYFLRADPAWAEGHLLVPLRSEKEDALVLWHAIARRTQFPPSLDALAEQMVRRVTDQRLSRSTRQSLLFSLIVECLHALRSRRRPAASNAQVEQLLRAVEDEVRAHGAEVVQQFLRDVGGEKRQTREGVFEAAVAPFLRSVWPQERSLATPGVARAFADLPAAAGDAFVAAVDAVARFLVPFDAWSSIEYGLYGDTEGPKLDIINTRDRAFALLRLLDATIGTAEDAVKPHDLSAMLSHIRDIAPKSTQTVAFRRLATAARM